MTFVDNYWAWYDWGYSGGVTYLHCVCWLRGAPRIAVVPDDPELGRSQLDGEPEIRLRLEDVADAADSPAPVLSE